MRHLDASFWSAHAQTWFEASGIDRVVAFSVPLTTRFRSVSHREGLLVRGAYGWGECSPFLEYGPQEAATWLQGAVADASNAPPPAVRDTVPVNVTVPVGTPDEGAARVWSAGCPTAKVKVADPRLSPEEDRDRVAAVAGVLADQFGARARVRVDVNGAWGEEEACRLLEGLQRAAAAAGGLEYVEQPCETVEELAFVRRHSGVPVAADESIRRADDPFKVVELEAADLAVVKVFPLGGVGAAYRLSQALPIPVVVSSAIDTSIGLAAGVALAAAVPDLPFACGLDTQRLLGADVVSSPLRSSAGELSVLEARNVTRGPLSAQWAPLEESVARRWAERTERMIVAAGSPA